MGTIDETALLIGELLAALANLDGNSPDERDKLQLLAASKDTAERRLAVSSHLLSLPKQLRVRLFGRARPRLVRRFGILVASIDGQHLCLSLGAAIVQKQLRLKGDVLFLDVADGRFTLTRRNKTHSKIIATFELSDLIEAVAFHDSLWAMIFPAHHAIIVETSALNLRSLGGKFLLDDGCEIERRLNCFVNPYTRLQSLDELARATPEGEPGPRLAAENFGAEYIFRKYNTCRSKIFDFGSAEHEGNRDDFVTTSFGNPEQHHDFAIVPEQWPDDARQWKLACFDLLNMLAVRRAKLFRADFAARVFNLLFPPLLLKASSSQGTCYALFPSLNLYRDQERDLRRTASLTFTIIPVSRSHQDSLDCGARIARLRELHRFKDALDSSPLAAIASTSDCYRMISVAKGYYRDIFEASHLSTCLQLVAKDIARRVYGKAVTAEREKPLEAMIQHSHSESRLTTVLIQVDWKPRVGDNEPWESWLSGSQDEVFSDALYRTMYYKDYLFPEQAYTSRRAIKLTEFNIGNTLGADMTGMTLFNPQDRIKFCLYSAAFEAYPNYSILRWATWQIYIDSRRCAHSS